MMQVAEPAVLQSRTIPLAVVVPVFFTVNTAQKVPAYWRRVTPLGDGVTVSVTPGASGPLWACSAEIAHAVHRGTAAV